MVEAFDDCAWAPARSAQTGSPTGDARQGQCEWAASQCFSTRQPDEFSGLGRFSPGSFERSWSKRNRLCVILPSWTATRSAPGALLTGTVSVSYITRAARSSPRGGLADDVLRDVGHRLIEVLASPGVVVRELGQLLMAMHANHGSLLMMTPPDPGSFPSRARASRSRPR